MLEGVCSHKVKKGNLYISITKYKATDLRVDLSNGEIFISVDFFRENSFIFRKEYRVGSTRERDIDFHELLDILHTRLNEKI